MKHFTNKQLLNLFKYEGWPGWDAPKTTLERFDLIAKYEFSTHAYPFSLSKFVIIESEKDPDTVMFEEYDGCTPEKYFECYRSLYDLAEAGYFKYIGKTEDVNNGRLFKAVVVPKIAVNKFYGKGCFSGSTLWEDIKPGDIIYKCGNSFCALYRQKY